MLRFGVLGAAIVGALAIGTPASAGDSAKFSGFYLGANLGYHWGDVEVTNDAPGVNPGPFNYDIDGVFGGGQVGYNWQLSSFLIGVEADLGYIDPDGEYRIPSSTPGHYQRLSVDGGFYADVTARLGIVLDHTLVYGKGGWAYFDGEASQVTTKTGYAPTGTGSFDGWVLGGGIEHKLSANWSIKAEYLHFDFGSENGYQTATIADPPTPVGYRFNNYHDLEVDTVKVGINYFFGGRDERVPLK